MKGEVIDLSKIKREKHVREDVVYCFDHISWEAEYAKDEATGNVLLISEPEFIKKNDPMNIAKNSILDPSFEIPVELGKKVVEYCCACRELIGRFNEGRVCPKCNKEVKANYSINLLKRGWIDLENYFLIIPGMYRKIEKFIGRRQLEEILYPEDQFRSHSEKNRNKSLTPFKGIGVREFKNRYKEILEYFRKRSKNPQLYSFLMERKNITFTTKILVMSIAFRPMYVSPKKELYYHEINGELVSLLTNLKLMKKNKVIDIDGTLGKMQKNLTEIYEYVISKFKKKDVDPIKQSVVASKVWYSSRMVITSESDLNDIDCVRLSYKSFLGLFKLEIINCMMHGYTVKDFVHMTALECLNYLDVRELSDTIDERVYQIMLDLIDLDKRKDDGLWVLVIRNPSFVPENLQTFRIAGIFKGTKDYLSIPHNSLKGFDGDYDGDVLNVYSLKEKCVMEAMKEYRPSKLILNNLGESFNPFSVPIDDELVHLKCFNDRDFSPIDTNKETIRDYTDIMKEIRENEIGVETGTIEYLKGQRVPDPNAMVDGLNLSTYKFTFSPYEGMNFEPEIDKKRSAKGVKLLDDILSDQFTPV